MKRFATIMLLVGIGIASGCAAEVDEKLLADTKREIANLGSQAQCPGPRSQAQIDTAAAQVASAQAHVDQLARRSR